MNEQHSAKNLGKSEPSSTSVLSHSVLIRPSWSSSIQQQQDSAQTTTSSSTLSLDQLSLYAKKISNASLNPFSTSPSISSSTRQNKDEEQKKKALSMKAEQVSNGFLRILLLSMNNSSFRLYTVSEHIQHKVPRIVELKKKMKQVSDKVETANLNVEDAQKSICDMEQIDSFMNILDIIKASIDIINTSSKTT